MATPIEQALALANAGQPVPEALQMQVFQFAGANNMGAADLERIFNVPAGTAAATTQALGIADQVPSSLGGNMAPRRTVDSGLGNFSQLRRGTGVPEDIIPPSQRMGLPPTTAGGIQYDPSLINNDASLATQQLGAASQILPPDSGSYGFRVPNDRVSDIGPIDSSDRMGGGIGNFGTEGEGTAETTLPPMRQDGNYTPEEVTFVTEQLRTGALSPADAASFYGVEEQTIRDNLTAAGVQIPGPPAGTAPPPPGTGGGAGTIGSNSVQGLINKFKSGANITDADQINLYNMARDQGLDINQLANMAGVTTGSISQNLQRLGLNPDALRTSAFGPGTGYPNPTVTTPTGAQTTITREAPEIEARKLGLIDLAKQLASREPTGGLPQYKVAGLSDDEIAGYDMARNYKGKALEAAGQGFNTLGEVKQGLYNVAENRIPTSDAGVKKYLEEFDPFVQGGIGTLNMARRRADAAGDVGLASAAGGIRRLRGTTAEYDPSNVSTYMNPYETAVIDAAMEDVARQGEKRRQGIRAQAVQQGAFGGSRAALTERDLDRDIAQQQARLAGELRMSGFNQAQQNALAAFENAKRRGQTAAQLTGTLGQAGAGTSLQSAGTLGNLAGLTGRLGESRSRLGLEGVNQYGDTTKTLLTAGDLGRQVGINQMEGAQLGQDILIKDIATQEAAGQGQRAAQQRILDADRANRMQDIQEPFGRAAFMSDILRGAPSSSMSMVKDYNQQPTGAAQAIGAVGSLAATTAGAKRAGII